MNTCMRWIIDLIETLSLVYNRKYAWFWEREDEGDCLFEERTYKHIIKVNKQ